MYQLPVYKYPPPGRPAGHYSTFQSRSTPSVATIITLHAPSARAGDIIVEIGIYLHGRHPCKPLFTAHPSHHPEAGPTVVHLLDVAPWNGTKFLPFKHPLGKAIGHVSSTQSPVYIWVRVPELAFTPKKLAKQCIIHLHSYLDYSKSMLRIWVAVHNQSWLCHF